MTTENTPIDPLDALASQAATLETSTDNPAPGEEAEIPKLSNEQAIAGAIGAAREAFCFFTKLESPKRILNDGIVGELGALWAPVADKYNLNLGDYMVGYALELAAAIGTITIVSQLRSAVSAEIAIKKAAQDSKDAEQATADAGRTVNADGNGDTQG